MKKTLSVFFACLTVLFLVWGCGQKKEPVPDDLLDRDTFAALMLDVQLAEGLKSQRSRSNTFSKDWSREVYEDIFIRHEISEEDFQKTYSWYQTRPDLMEGIYEQVLDSLSTLEAEIKQAYANETKAMRDSSEDKKTKLKKERWREGINYMPDMAHFDSTSADSAGVKKPFK